MNYLGSKNKYAKELLPIILKDRKKEQWYVEPFVGGFNLIDKVDGNRLANDVHFYLIELFKAIQKGWDPPISVTEEGYNNIKNDKEGYPPYLVGFVGFGCSYSGKWFGGYARGNSNSGVPRNYCDERRRNILKQYSNLQGITIKNKSYLDLFIPPKSIIYCDPPYQSTTKYKDSIDYNIFWNWIRDLVEQNHTVFVSEYNAPDDFVSIWNKKTSTSLSKEEGTKQRIENLWIKKK